MEISSHSTIYCAIILFFALWWSNNPINLNSQKQKCSRQFCNGPQRWPSPHFLCLSKKLASYLTWHVRSSITTDQRIDTIGIVFDFRVKHYYVGQYGELTRAITVGEPRFGKNILIQPEWYHGFIELMRIPKAKNYDNL